MKLQPIVQIPANKWVLGFEENTKYSRSVYYEKDRKKVVDYNGEIVTNILYFADVLNDIQVPATPIALKDAVVALANDYIVCSVMDEKRLYHRSEMKEFMDKFYFSDKFYIQENKSGKKRQFWVDPDNGECSNFIEEIIEMEDSEDCCTVKLVTGSEVEVYYSEIVDVN